MRTALPTILALSTSLAAQSLFVIDSSRALSMLDPATGAKTLVANVTSNAGTTGGLAFDLISNTVYLTSTSLDSLYTLDLHTGIATLVGAYGDAAIVMHGLEFDSSTGTLYGASSHNGGLYSIDTNTGVATLIGTTGLTSFLNLVHDPAGNVLYATNSNTDSLYTIDRTTGAATLVGPLLGPTNPNGLAWDLANNRLYLVCNNTDALYRIDTTTGAATLVGSMGSGNTLGLVYLPTGGFTRHPHGCGPTTLTVTGAAYPGVTLNAQLGNVTGLGFLGLGFVYNPQPLCVCTMGHEWSTSIFGNQLALAVPTSPNLSGLPFAIQGADFLGNGGCAAPQLTLTDTFTVQVF